MKGYLNNPQATKDSITKEGWFKSGDIAVRDEEGYYYIVDRKKELIKYKGCVVSLHLLSFLQGMRLMVGGGRWAVKVSGTACGSGSDPSDEGGYCGLWSDRYRCSRAGYRTTAVRPHPPSHPPSPHSLTHSLVSSNRAYVVPTTPLSSAAATAAFENDVQEWIKPRVARHKWLRGGVRVVREIPKTASGKILRRELREAAKLEERGSEREEVVVGARL